MPSAVQAPPVWRVWAVRLGGGLRPARDNFLNPGHRSGNAEIDFITWVISRDEQIAVVDTGFSAAVGARRGRTLEIGPGRAVELLGLDPAVVRHVVLTHLHYDHAGNIDDFPAAKVVVQQAELAYSTGPAMRHGRLSHFYEPADVVGVVTRLFSGGVQTLDGDLDLAPGLQLALVGGHTRGTQIVRVYTERGWVVLAGDAIHYWDNLRERNPFPAVLDVEQVLDGYERIESLADSAEHIVPGHDPEIFRRYELVPNAERIRIAALHCMPRTLEQQA